MEHKGWKSVGSVFINGWAIELDCAELCKERGWRPSAENRLGKV